VEITKQSSGWQIFASIFEPSVSQVESRRKPHFTLLLANTSFLCGIDVSNKLVSVCGTTVKSLCPFFRLHTCNDSRAAEQIFIKRDILKLKKKSSFGGNRAGLMDILNVSRCPFLCAS
jgi:hypothetical protein